MVEVKELNIILKENLNLKDYEDINNLQKLCLEKDKTSLKLELDYKLAMKEAISENIKYINEFMYYSDNILIGYIGIGSFGGGALEVNGMVHPEFRRRGIFSRLFSLVKDEWSHRKSQTILLLSDNNSISGLEFIKCTGASHDHSEYEMYLKNYNNNTSLSNVGFRMATKEDSREIAMQNSIYFGKEFNEEDIPLISEDNRMVTYIAEVNNKIIGKINLEVNNFVGGIYGLGVLPQYRGKGYGRDILMWGIEELKEMNSKEVMLQVSVVNKNALNLYKSCGFEETSTMDYYKLIK